MWQPPSLYRGVSAWPPAPPGSVTCPPWGWLGPQHRADRSLQLPCRQTEHEPLPSPHLLWTGTALDGHRWLKPQGPHRTAPQAGSREGPCLPSLQNLETACEAAWPLRQHVQGVQALAGQGTGGRPQDFPPNKESQATRLLVADVEPCLSFPNLTAPPPLPGHEAKRPARHMKR